MNPMHTHILNNSWEAYNKRKVMYGQDPNCFSPEVLWEFNYLVDIISAAKPHLDQITVILAVREGSRRTLASRLREHFVELVMDNISEREKQWTLLMEGIGKPGSVSPSAMNFPFMAN